MGLCPNIDMMVTLPLCGVVSCADLLCVIVHGTQKQAAIPSLFPAAVYRGDSGLRLLRSDSRVWLEAVGPAGPE